MSCAAPQEVNAWNRVVARVRGVFSAGVNRPLSTMPWGRSFLRRSSFFFISVHIVTDGDGRNFPANTYEKCIQKCDVLHWTKGTGDAVQDEQNYWSM
uniref:Uncharacterized protein n=1 Tax=Arundo donax TaxID=35708 RepID=A0A0A9D409_ARUDO